MYNCCSANCSLWLQIFFKTVSKKNKMLVSVINFKNSTFQLLDNYNWELFNIASYIKTLASKHDKKSRNYLYTVSIAFEGL